MRGSKAGARAKRASVALAPKKGAGAKSRGREEPRADRSKRLLDLVMLLLGARVPVTFREIRVQFESYQTSNIEAGLRAFERDKADLLELGVPIRYITPEEDDTLEDGGYVIDLKRYRLPEVRLTADEISALVLAGSVARAIPGGIYPKIVDLAIKKLVFDMPELSDTPMEFPARRPVAPGPVLVHFPEQRAPRAQALGEHFATLEQATRLRKRVRLTYQTAATGFTSQRDVDPYALALRDGAWIAIGYCHVRREIRSFRVDRVLEAVMAPKPKSPDFERPADFNVSAYVHRSPWIFSSEPAEQVELLISREAMDVTNEDFGAEAVKTISADGATICFVTGNPDFVVSRVLAAKGAIRVVRGATVRARLADELRRIAERYA